MGAAESVSPAVGNIEVSQRSADRRAVRLATRAIPTRRLAAAPGSSIAPDGYIITNSHVVHRAPPDLGHSSDGRKSSAELIGDDPGTDLAVIR